MKTLTVALPGRSYDIVIQRGLLAQAGAYCRKALPRASRLFVVTDSTVAPLYLDTAADSLTAAGFRVGTHTVPAGEGSKCAGRLAELWEAMMAFGLTRTDAVVALGGGVVGDLVDSSVGGKVAVDLAHGKNLAGAFWQPRLVLMDPDTLDTLDDKTFADGMAEVVKYGCIKDAAFFDFLAERPSRTELMAEIEHILYTCCDIKRIVVEMDERDTGERMLLNFGHTLGHAYELAGHYEIWSHGQAVAAGMCAAACLGVRLGVTPADIPARLEGVLAALGLPTSIPCSPEEYAAAVGLDKKGTGDEISVILLEKLGRAIPHRMTKAALLEELA